MNFGTSRNGRAARREGRGPASWLAARIGGGITAAWIRANCQPSEWHHSQAGLGGDGAPVDYFSPEEVLPRWFAANLVARRTRVARRRLFSLRQLARRYELTPAELVSAARDGKAPSLPPNAAEQAADPLLGRRVRVRRYWTERARSRHTRYSRHEETIEGTVEMATTVSLRVGEKLFRRANILAIEVLSATA
ncbi:MAG: hypothetical protein AABZ12_12855 [Planctomycetota bacterium]